MATTTTNNFVSYHSVIAEKILSNPNLDLHRTMSMRQLDAILDMVGRFDVKVDFETVTTIEDACRWMLATDQAIQSGEVVERSKMFRNRELKAAFEKKWPSLLNAIINR